MPETARKKGKGWDRRVIGYYAFIIIGYYSAVDRFTCWPLPQSDLKI